MIRFEKTDTEKPIQPDDGRADASGVGRRRVTHYFSSKPRPAWNECVRCHRMGTLVETPATENDENVWTCRKCGAVNPHNEIDAYFDEVMSNDVDVPKCPSIMTKAMLRCAEMLFRHFKGEHMSRAEAGNAARLLIHRVERYGAEEEEWFDDAEK